MNTSQAVSTRQTKYCIAIEAAIQRLGHATNLELLQELRRIYPALSATTVHRATLRLASRGKIAVAPPAKDGSVRYDANLKPHDHFQCIRCGKVLDTDVKEQVTPILKANIAGCNLAGRLSISGICKHCDTMLKEEERE